MGWLWDDVVVTTDPMEGIAMTSVQDGNLTTYIDVVTTAKLIRKVLKDKFPGVKFSVRSNKYSGGASIDVGWTDGPTGSDVDAVVGPFSGSNFDGMIDLKFGVEAWLEDDGTATLAHSPATNGSCPEMIGSRRTAGARLVHFGADFVFTSRALSDEFVAKVQAQIETDGRKLSGGNHTQCQGCFCFIPEGDYGYVVSSTHRGYTHDKCVCKGCAARVQASSVDAGEI